MHSKGLFARTGVAGLFNVGRRLRIVKLRLSSRTEKNSSVVNGKRNQLLMMMMMMMIRPATWAIDSCSMLSPELCRSKSHK